MASPSGQYGDAVSAREFIVVQLPTAAGCQAVCLHFPTRGARASFHPNFNLFRVLVPKFDPATAHHELHALILVVQVSQRVQQT